MNVITVVDPANVEKAVASLLDKTTVLGWVAVKYVSGTQISLQAVGVGSGIPDLVKEFQENQIQYALIRLPPKGDAVTKDIFLTWVGPKVSKIEQGKKGEHLADLRELLGPAHSSLTALTKVNFTEEKIRELSDPAAGSHVLKLADQ